jgi:signal peptidase II
MVEDDGPKPGAGSALDADAGPSTGPVAVPPSTSPFAEVAPAPAATELPSASVGPMSEPPRSLIEGEGGASYRFLAVVTFLAAASDLVTKWWAKARLSGFDSRAGGPKRVTLLDNLDFIYAQNPGGAWSFLRGLPEYVRRPFFLFVSAAAIVFIVSIYRRVRPDQTAMKWGLPLALGGAIGNLVDRIRYGYVIDFIDVYVTRGNSEHHWPTFNVADVWICVGVGLMAVDMIAASRRARAQEKELAAIGTAESLSGEPPT